MSAPAVPIGHNISVQSAMAAFADGAAAAACLNDRQADAVLDASWAWAEWSAVKALQYRRRAEGGAGLCPMSWIDDLAAEFAGHDAEPEDVAGLRAELEAIARRRGFIA